MTTEPVLSAESVSKRYGGVQALDRVSIDLQAGEIHALVGENGAGKTTLERILAGEEQPDEGRLIWHRQTSGSSSSREARGHGVAVVHQHFSLVPAMTVAQNLFLDDPPARFRLGPLTWIDHDRMVEEAAEILAPFDLRDRVMASIRSLTVAEKQIVEIAKALSRDAGVLILDEPTSSLNPSEAEQLFEHVRRLRDEGCAVVFISHRMDEVMEIADCVTVLRDGQHVTTTGVDEVDGDDIVAMIVGRSLDQAFPEIGGESGEELLTAQSLRPTPWQGPWDLEVRAGEILGVAGLLGSGVGELVRTITGAHPQAGGEVILAGEDVSRRDIGGRIKAGLCLVSGDLDESLADNLTIAENIVLPNLGELSRLGIRKAKASDELVRALIDSLDVRPPEPDVRVDALSGGNKQKVAIAKWLASRPRVLVMDDPFRGVDVGAKTEICRVMSEFAGSGRGILFASSDLFELLGMSERLVVMRRGEMVREFSREFQQEEITAAVLGLDPGHKAESGTSAEESER